LYPSEEAVKRDSERSQAKRLLIERDEPSEEATERES
jgi:hypothetical protein